MENFITVPKTTLPSGIVVPTFEVGQFCCSTDSEGKAFVSATEKPRVRISYFDAVRACEESGLKLITELQWLAIAYDVANQDCNWTKGKVGEGKLYRGIRKALVSEAQPGSFEPTDPKERRWLRLSNGARICDMNGNVFSWVFDDVQGDERGIVTKAFAEDSPSMQAPYPSMSKGMGWRPNVGDNWSGNALVRGGCWFSERSGVFCLSIAWNDGAGGNVGFRCTKSF